MNGEQKIMRERGALWHPPYLALHQRELVRVDSTLQGKPRDLDPSSRCSHTASMEGWAIAAEEWVTGDGV